MVVDRTEQKFHLTPKGWVCGPLNTMLDAKPTEIPTADRVLTITVSTSSNTAVQPGRNVRERNMA